MQLLLITNNTNCNYFINRNFVLVVLYCEFYFLTDSEFCTINTLFKKNFQSIVVIITIIYLY